MAADFVLVAVLPEAQNPTDVGHFEFAIGIGIDN